MRLVEKTPGIFDLYKDLIPKKMELRKALGLTSDAAREYAEENGFDALIDLVRTDDAFVKKHRLESLRETLTLGYPSYIFALAMGTGKTMLIGAIIATEFAMAQEYPRGDFVHNALVFAPGKTIIESLCQLASMPFDGILPPRMHKPFAASVKFTFTRDGTHWRVNDYDLAIQHNEAVALACEYMGVERLRSDTFFDGLLGRRLVKIIPFGHPLSPMDLEAIRNELDARPDEDRAITVVCLGKELAADAWLADWSRLRRKKSDPHHIEVIELRNDPKYGGFIQHEKAQARIEVKRKGVKLHVEIKDFVSPGILQRLAQQSGVVQAKIADWRSMVDSVMIDTAFDGAVFNVVHADVPARKIDLVAGTYEVDAPTVEATVAVKITDMLGEEVLITQMA